MMPYAIPPDPTDFYDHLDLQRSCSTDRDHERELRAAVLAEAVDEFDRCRKIPSARQILEEVVDWFHGRGIHREHASTWPYSFTRICEALDLDPADIRRLVLSPEGIRLREDRRHGARPAPTAKTPAVDLKARA